MTSDHIIHLGHEINRLGCVFIKKDGEFVIEAVEKGELSKEEAMQEIMHCWNSLPMLMREVNCLSEDHARLTYTLHQINARVVDAMQGTARSEIAADWWQATDESNG